MDDQIYAITNLEGYVADMRIMAAKSLSDDAEKENLDDYITLEQMTNLVKSECLGYDDLNRPLLNEDVNAKLYEQVAIWIHNVGLARLAAQDLIDCAWDDEVNDFVFSAKTKEKKTNGKRTRSRRKNMGDQK